VLHATRLHAHTSIKVVKQNNMLCYFCQNATHEMHTETVRVDVRYLCAHIICKEMRLFGINLGVLELQTETDVHTDINT
jgi:hypothetical protein